MDPPESTHSSVRRLLDGTWATATRTHAIALRCMSLQPIRPQGAVRTVGTVPAGIPVIVCSN